MGQGERGESLKKPAVRIGRIEDWRIGGLGSGHTNYAILLMKDRELPAK